MDGLLNMINTKSMKKFTPLFSLALIVIAGFSAKAQQHDNNGMHGWFMHNIAGSAMVQVTYRPSKLGQLNQILNNNGIASLPGNNIWINLVAQHIHAKWLFEDGIGFTPTSTSGNNNNLKAKYNQAQLYFRAGYDISKTPSFRLYPFGGINLSLAQLRIQDNNRIDNTSDFSQELLNSTSSKTLYQPNFGIDLGLGFDYLIGVKPKKMECFELERNIPIGFRLGYYINAASHDWKVDGHSLNSSPNQKQSNIFVSVNIGLGYVVKK